MKPLAPNTMIQGRYLVVHLIGKGGMGEVYLAVDQRLGSAVAVKRTSFAEDQMLAAAFEREAKILARLRHPVLPKVSDHFVDNGEQYLVMEHISGDDLSKRLEVAQKPFPVSWAMFWADQLLDALSYLHSHEPPIIHRDIKPQNLKLTDENHIVLLDFGLSKDTANQSVVSKPGTSGSIVGYTPHFAPMEQIRGTGTNPRSDIYALSATLYQLMTDSVPADALTRADAVLNGQPDPIRPLSELNPEISPAVSNAILKGLELSQEKRFPTASEMQRALRAAHAQIKGQMAADTVAFNLADHAGADIHSTSPPIDHGRSVAPSEMATRTPNSVPPVPPPVTPAVNEPSMDATIRMTSPEVTEELHQSDMQTEVLLASEVPSQTQPTPSSTGDREPEQVATARSSAPTRQIEAFTPPASTASGPPPTRLEETRSAPATRVSWAATEASPEITPSVEPVRPAARQDAPAKGRSKAGMIIAALVGLFLITGAVAGGGWYYYANVMKAAVPSPSPTATASPTPEPSPSPSPSPEPTPDASSVNSNSQIPANAVSPTPAPAIPEATITKPSQPTLTPKNQAPAKTPAAPKATPKPKTGTDRTVILQ